MSRLRQQGFPHWLAAAFVLAALPALFAFPSGALAADAALYWSSALTSVDDFKDFSELYYTGLNGVVLGVEPADGPRAEALGAEHIDLLAEETLYVYLVQDGRTAEFQPPARVLQRAEREVLLATPGQPPELTPSSAATLTGLKQPVRVERTPKVWTEAAFEVPPGARTIDPLIADMVAALTPAHYQATWQILDDFETRYYSAPQNNLATQWLLDQFRSYGLTADFHYYQQSGQRRNVVATLPGTVDPTRVVYICGHMDATSDTPTVCAPGADDNGSGTAAVVEAARILSQYLFEYTIKFVCFNGEEQGLVGSAAYAADMAAQGENIIGVYNCDMIAYRGTDPAPADLVIYTNAASQALATTLQTAIQDYVPGQIEAVIHVEALNGSDHASFWNHGYPAICSIEDEAWGSDFCPWYHTCNDRIERYPQDYPVSCARANLAALATTARPLNPDGPYLILGSAVIDDDASGGSSGNGDGTLNPGETIELNVTLRNVGNATALGVHGQLATSSPDCTILTANANWNNIPAGGQGLNLTAFRFQISATAADGGVIPLSLTVFDNSGSRIIPLEFPVLAPVLSYRDHRLNDVDSGNGSGVIDPGEVISLPVTLINHGGQSAANVVASLTSLSGHATVLSGQSQFALIPSGGQGELAPGFSVFIDPQAPVGEVLGLRMSITAGSGYQTESDFRIKVGTAFYDDLESDRPWSLAAADDNATSGRWILVDPIGTQQNGQQAQSEDDHTAAPWTECMVTGQGTQGGAAGDADVDGGKTTLTTPTVDLSLVPEPRLTYWRWYTNNLGNNPTQDYWVVQVSSNGGASWVDLERTTASNNSWQQQSFALNTFIVPSNQVVVRFVASDEPGGSLVEAAVDDVEFSGNITPTTGVETPAVQAVFRLDAARPSPVLGGTVLRFALPASGPVQLQLFAVDGRLVRTLRSGVLAAGEHSVTWDGRTDEDHAAAPGVYFYRLRSADREMTRRLVVIR